MNVLLVSARSCVEICSHVYAYIIVVGVGIFRLGVFGRFITQSKYIICACIFQIKHAICPRVRISKPIYIRIVKITASVTV